MHYKTCETLLLISSHLNSKYIFDLVYLTSEKENPFFNKNSHRQRHFSGNLNGLNTLLQGGRAAPLFQTCTSTSRKAACKGVPCHRGLCLGYRNANNLCSRKLPHPMQYWHKRKFNCKPKHVLPCLLEERPKQLSLLFFLSSIKSASVSPGEAHVIPAVTREVAAVATQKTKTCPYTQHRQGQAKQTEITGSTTDHS